MKAQEFKSLSGSVHAEMTVFLSLLFVIFLSFIGGILESASLQGMKSEKRADVSLAMDSVFAEYHSKLFELYHIFSLDGSYESDTYEEKKICDRLNYYAGMEAKHEIEKIQMLTDHNGQAFYEQAVRWMETEIGHGVLEQIPKMEELWKEQEEQYTDREEELDQALEEVEEALPSEENPFTDVIRMRNDDFLKKILPKSKQISEKRVNMSELPTGRRLLSGRGEFSNQVLGNETVSDILFGEYMLRHYNNGVTEREDCGKGLAYEMEYILEGTDEDGENLTRILRKIQGIRLALNYGFLLSDAQRCAKVQTWAAALSAVILMPELTEVLKHALLLVWSYRETVADLRILMAGEKCVFWKTDSSWRTEFSEILIPDEQTQEETKDENGIKYEDYLRMFYAVTAKETMRMRAIDMLEINLRKQEGMDYFRADKSVNKIEMRTTCTFRRGISYQFKTCYEYR